MIHSGITVVLNVYKRAQHLKEQFNAILNQTIEPKEIYIWNNGNTGFDFDFYKNHPKVTFFDSSHNFGVWSRFLIVLNSNSEYIAVFDDDTIPGKKWFENCIDTLKDTDAALGTIGARFKPGIVYDHITRIGWYNPNDEIAEVDLICHAWFFRRTNFDVYPNDLPDTKLMPIYGEDMHITYTFQKYKKLKTLVPKHPKQDQEMWGSEPKKAMAYGLESCAISVNINFKEFSIPYQRICNFGFESMSNKDLFLKNYEKSISYFTNKMIKNEPFSLIRLSDRDIYIFDNIYCQAIDGWIFKPDSKLSKQYPDILKMNNSNNYYGIPGKCDDEHVHNLLKTRIFNKSNLTFNNIFCNGNYSKFIEFIENNDLNVILISPNAKKISKIGKLRIIDSYEIDELLLNKWDQENQVIHLNNIKDLARNNCKKIFLFSGGPIAKLFIFVMHSENPDNIYLDVGSAIDPFTKNKKTRDYQNECHSMRCHKCYF